MGSKMATSGPHSAGIFADMTVDGPEIGTLVIVVDRAKNLPNRKTMGKQNPYCAARLGKEARKTETDERGGQTPKWDQELRFTVHDSPDYYNLKVSVFSEDKRTDLIGEAWVSLADVVVPGGGKSDLWQQLNCKGKYSGEIRIEVTYYDTRERPEKSEHITSVADELKETYGGLHPKVKRRPLPVNPNAPNTTPVVIAERAAPGRAKHGPRDFTAPPRANSLPAEGPKAYNYPHSQSTLFGQSSVHTQPLGDFAEEPAPIHAEQPPNELYYGEYDPNLGPQLYESQPDSTLDFLPQLGPSSRQRTSMPPQARYQPRQAPPPQQPRPQSHIGLQHAHSAPTVPVTHPEEDSYMYSPQESREYSEHTRDPQSQYHPVRPRRGDMAPGWDNGYGGHEAEMQHYSGYAEDEQTSPPPPPPMHSNSSPAIPQMHSHPSGPGSSRYGGNPSLPRAEYNMHSSPSAGIDRQYAPQQTPPNNRFSVARRSVGDFSDPPYHGGYASSPNLTTPFQTPPSHGPSSPYSGQQSHRHSLADPYSTPSRPHPLSQEMPRTRDQTRFSMETLDSSPYQPDQRQREAPRMVKPRPLSPQPPPQSSSAPPSSKAKNLYSIQNPVRAFESSEGNPLSTSQASTRPQQVPRKSISPHPPASADVRSAVPFSPDSFGVHNPSAPDPSLSRNGPIVGWHGQEIDPSDHLPVDSWAPEPEKKNPIKTYGLGRDRDFGPRNAQGITNSAGRVSRDTMVNVRVRQPQQQAPPPPPPAEPAPKPEPVSNKIRARLVKRQGPGGVPPVEPLGDHANFNPPVNHYDQQQHQPQPQYYSPGYRDVEPGMAEAYGDPYHGYGPPSLPPKLSLQREHGGPDALAREISNIDIGPSRRGPSPAHFVPVRSHRDRYNYY